MTNDLAWKMYRIRVGTWWRHQRDMDFITIGVLSCGKGSQGGNILLSLDQLINTELGVNEQYANL